MSEYYKCACPHCGQSIEYPAEGTGQTVPCPTCEKPVTLTPANQPQSNREAHRQKELSEREIYVARVRSEPATEKQKEKLRWFGCVFAEGMTKGQASDLIDKCVRDFPEKDRAYYARPATDEQLTQLRPLLKGSRTKPEDFAGAGKPLTYGRAKDLIWEHAMEKRHSDRLDELRENRMTLLVDRLVYYRGEFCPHFTIGRVRKAAKALDKIDPEWMEDKNSEDLLLQKVAELNPEWAVKEDWLRS